MKIEVEGVELVITQVNGSVYVSKVVGRDRTKKPAADIVHGRQLKSLEVFPLLELMKRVATLQTKRCTCGYHYGWSDHAQSCQSVYVAKYDGGGFDDD